MDTEVTVDQPAQDGKTKKKRKKRKVTFPKMTEKIFRVRLNPKQGRSSEGTETLTIKGRDTCVSDPQVDDGPAIFTIIAMDGSNSYTTEAFNVFDCVAEEFLVSEVVVKAGRAPLRSVESKVHPLDRGPDSKE